jgi:hypothetical protein
MWINELPFEWGSRPNELIGKTSMKAKFIDKGNIFYYGETSLDDPDVLHGKGIMLVKDGYNSLYECWFVNNKRKGRGRMMDKA